MIRAGIIGATGYTGQELVHILLHHPHVRITGLYSTTDQPKPYAQVFPQFKNKIGLMLEQLAIKEVIAHCDVVFLALPHTTAMEFVPYLLKAGKKVIDLSADYRFKNAAVYAKAYNIKHKDPLHLKHAVYGLPEIYRNKIKDASLVANPGCYPTAAILGLAPLLALNALDMNSIIIDAKSGTTGAGKKAVQELLFSEMDEDFRAYKVNKHQHMPEINQELSKLAGKQIKVTFVPHILPVKRGILETIYVRSSSKDVLALYRKFYKDESFVRIRQEGSFPSLKDVTGTNFCDIGISQQGQQVIIISAIDNLVKGASGQAVQNMNIMCKFPQTLGLL